MTDPATLGTEGTPYLAVDVQPDMLAGTFTLDVSELGGPDMLAWTPGEGAGVWVNIVCDVRSATIRTGATRMQGVLTRAEAGTVSIVATDTSGELDPMTNGDAIHRNTPLRVRAWGTDADGDPWTSVLWTGVVEEVSAQYLYGEPPLVTITGMDLIGLLATWSSEGYPDPGVGAGDDLRGRVARVLTEVGTGSIATDSDTVFEASLAATNLATPWQNISDAADAELGRVWVDRDNKLVVRARGSALSGAVRGTLSDVHGEAVLGVHCCIADAVIRYSPELLANRAIASRRVTSGTSAVVRRDDAYSQARYGLAVVERSDLDLSSDTQLGPWGQAVVVDGARPELRVDSVIPSPSPSDLDSALTAWPAVCATGIGDRWLFRYRTHTGRLVSRTIAVLGIDWEMTPDAWTVTWSTTESATTGRGWFVLGVTELGGPELLAPYSVPVRA